MSNISYLIFLPFVLASFIPFIGIRSRDLIVIFFVLLLACFSIDIFLTNTPYYSFTFSHDIHNILKALDIILLLYFLLQGFKHKDKLVLILAFVQLSLYGVVLIILPEIRGLDILSDELSKVMYLVVNIVGAAIIIYALEYIESENFSRLKKTAL